MTWAMKKIAAICALSAVAALGCAQTANATVITQTATIASTDTDWANSLSFTKFNAGLGTLNSITFSLSGTADGSLFVENTSTKSGATITSTLQATLTLTRPDLSTLVTIVPLGGFTDTVTKYDGVLDFGGTSGKTHSGLSFSASNSFVSVSASDFALFSGAGFIFLPVTADGSSTFTGGGNLVSGASETADATVTVTYDYTKKVPEPLTLSLFGAGIAGIAAARRRKKAA
jgi:hypothetical protein